MNFGFSFTKKKKASPTMPYNFIKVPKRIRKAAMKLFFLSIIVYDNIMMAVMDGFIWKEKREVSNSFAISQ